MPAPTRRVVLHVGTPKSGTTFIQETLRANAERLHEHGVLFATKERHSGFRAASEMRESYAHVSRTPEELAGSWEGLCVQAREFPGTSVISNEHFGAANRRQIEAMLARLDGLDVHVVLTARDLARTFPAAWQQSAKQGGQREFARHEQLVVRGVKDRGESSYFWRTHDVPSVLERWGARLPRENVHLVTVPPADQPMDVLWQRFCAVMGVRSEDYPLAVHRANVSLGTVEIEVLHRVSRVVQERDVDRRLARFVNRYYIREVLGRYQSPRAGTPERLMPLFEDIAAEWIATIESRGYHVEGDLKDLVPRRSDNAASNPDRVPKGEALDRAAATIVDLLEEVKGLRAELAQAQRTRNRGHSRRLLASLVRRTTTFLPHRTRSTP